MPRSQSFDVPLELMPRYVSAAVGLARDWATQGRCHPSNRPGDPRERTRVWFCDDSSLSDKEQALTRELALAECRICPVQWDCVTFAIDSGSTSGIWAVDKEDRRGLANLPEWRRIVGRAAAKEVSIHNVVVQLREAEKMPPRKRYAPKLGS